MPFGKRTSTVVFEGIAAIEVTVEVEMVVDGGLDRGELLQGLDVSKPRHRPFPSSKRLVGSFRPVVKPLATFLTVDDA